MQIHYNFRFAHSRHRKGLLALSKKIALLLAGLLFLLGAGCHSKRNTTLAPGYQYVIGVSQANLIEPWRVALYEEMKLQGQTYDNVRLVFADAAGDSGRQIDDVAHLVDLGIDLLIISPNDAEKLREVIANVHRDIPVIVLDRDVQGNDYNLFIGSDNRLIGSLAGEYAAKLLGEAGGTVLEITGKQDSPPAQALSQGFAEALAKYPKITTVGTLDGDWLRDTAGRRMKDFLIQSVQVDVVFAHSDTMAGGAYNAAKELRVNGIRFIGVDGLEGEGKVMMEDGILSGTFFRQTGGKEAIEWAVKLLEGEKDVPSRIVLEPVPIVGE